MQPTYQKQIDGFFNIPAQPNLGMLINTVKEHHITTPRFLTRFNATLLHERSKYFWQREQWRLNTPIVYISNIPKPRTLHVVPSTFVYDCSSVPMLPFIYLIFGRVGRRASGLHDLYYRWSLLSRLKADQNFKEALIVSESRIKAYPMYAAVRLGGVLSQRDWYGCMDKYKCSGPGTFPIKCTSCHNYYKSGPIGEGYFSEFELTQPACGFYYI